MDALLRPAWGLHLKLVELLRRTSSGRGSWHENGELVLAAYCHAGSVQRDVSARGANDDELGFREPGDRYEGPAEREAEVVTRYATVEGDPSEWDVCGGRASDQ